MVPVLNVLFIKMSLFAVMKLVESVASLRKEYYQILKLQISNFSGLVMDSIWPLIHPSVMTIHKDMTSIELCYYLMLLRATNIL